MHPSFYIPLLTAFVHVCWAVPNTNVTPTFRWRFADNRVSTSLPQCQNITLQAFASAGNTTIGTAPYYMMAFELGGTPDTQLLGSDPTNLIWQVRHPAGTQLILHMADADGNAGGSPDVFTVASGDGSCLPSASSAAFSITGNVTTELTTCQPWGTRISGGQKPYTVTLAQTNSHVVTNVTLGPEDDVLTYIDRADPKQHLLAAVSDANGVWARTSANVTTTGPQVTAESCGTLVTKSETSAQLAQDMQAAQQALATSHKRSTTVVAVVVTLAIVFLGVALALLYLYRRRRRALTGDSEKVPSEETPRPFTRMVSNDSVSPMLISQLEPAVKPRERPSVATAFPLVPSSSSSPSTSSSITTPQRTYSYSSGTSSHVLATSPGGSTSSRPNSTSPRPAGLPVNPQWARKVAEGRALPQRSATAHVPMRVGEGSGDARNSRRHTLGSSVDGDTAPAIIYQHRDGGTPVVVKELPPPYADRPSTAGSDIA